ncbi:threonine/serine exporter family protein [Sedimentibacter sp. zth1]|uniref:threonine/serine exporter family protein n=1 Tax=Sedimentibacter sp. zth1 TaxID=2816908 RepID=UPI001A92584E|nr:threonine/serine exporter family protein [Sedimentibacter sp. zth1]QSX05132.1 threonine/serine exporter family protein [Sedimentibacter sp. zth1]
MSTVNIDKLLKVLKLMTQIMMESGAEAYRVENTLDIIGKAFNEFEIDSSVTPTGAHITIATENDGERTIIRRIKNRSINLYKLNEVNTISRMITNREINLDEALIKLKELKSEVNIRKGKFYRTYEGIAAAFFTLLFKGGPIEFILAFLSGLIVQFISTKLGSTDAHKFFVGFFGSAIISVFAIIATSIIGKGDYNIIIIGGIMPLLPGLAMTNAIRDTMSGDLLSGVVRGTEAILVATALGAGAGIVLSLSFSIGII